MVSLKKLHVWMCTPIQRLKSLAAIADTCQGLFSILLLTLTLLHLSSR